MLFYEPLFLFVFLPASFALSFRLRRFTKARGWILLTSSVLFYLWGEPAFVPVVFLSAGLDYLLAPFIARGKRWALLAGLATNLGILAYYKYFNFVSANLLVLLGLFGTRAIPLQHIALPIGVSFVVFEKITYLIDVRRGLSVPAKRFSLYLTYVFFFPKLLAGPIIKYHEIEAQFRAPPPLDETQVLDGFARFMLGVIKKLLIADTVGRASDIIFSVPSDQLSFESAWIGVLLFTLQIYLDFSAYSDMAIGLANMFGFRLNENFDRPYISCSITEFWRRWHISLTSWVREYLYIPLGGNRVEPARRMINLWVCFLASGLWHGAAWTYVFWGAYNGLFLVLDRLFLLKFLNRMPRILANIVTLLIVMIGWTIFRATSLSQLYIFMHAMTHPALKGTSVLWENDLIVATVAGIIISLAPRVPRLEAILSRLGASRLGRLSIETLGVVFFAIALDKSITDPFRPFLYFRF